MNSRLKNLVGENIYALLRRIYRSLRSVTSFLKGYLPRRSTRRTVLKNYDGSLLLLYKDANDESPIIAGGDHELPLRKLFRAVVKPGDTVLDIGANCGVHAVLFANLCQPDGTVHAFEPVDYNIKKLNANLQLNRCENVVIHDYALGEADCQKSLRKIRESEYFKGNSSLVDNEKIDGGLRGKYDLEEIDVRRLDDVVQAFQLTVNVIKMDVEGYEYQVLLGAAETIRQQQPVIIMEYGTKRVEHVGLTNKDFEKLFRGLYDCYEICPGNTFDRYESLEPFLFDRELSFGNVLLIPQQKYAWKQRPPKQDDRSETSDEAAMRFAVPR